MKYERGNSDNLQILEVRKCAEGPFPEMGIMKGAVGSDSKLRGSVLASESLRCLPALPMEMVSRQSGNQDWSLTERLGLEI